jgi:hypothetical protein
MEGDYAQNPLGRINERNRDVSTITLSDTAKLRSFD